MFSLCSAYEYMEELKDQPTQSDENVLADKLSIVRMQFCIQRQILCEYSEFRYPSIAVL